MGNYRAWAVFMLVASASLQVSNGAVYKVGDSTGWTTIGNFDYKKWAATKTFQVGDTIRMCSSSLTPSFSVFFPSSLCCFLPLFLCLSCYITLWFLCLILHINCDYFVKYYVLSWTSRTFDHLGSKFRDESFTKSCPSNRLNKECVCVLY